jgi:hypothetical protein
MTAEGLFSLSNLAASVGWLLLILLPRSRRATMIAGTVIPVLLACAYVALLVSSWNNSRGGFSSLAGVSALFSNPWLLLAGWVHYLAFDLFVGTWETRDAATLGISRWLVIPCLALTFLFGPVGWLAYSIARTLAPRHNVVAAVP